jgi:hypothetical protein
MDAVLASKRLLTEILKKNLVENFDSDYNKSTRLIPD